MPRSPFFGIICGALGVLVLLWSGNSPEVDPRPPAPGPTPQPSRDLVVASFDLYERLWRETAAQTADKLERGELSSEAAAWQFIADRQGDIRKQAFEQIAQREQKFFTDAGGWSAQNHAKLLRSYTNAR